MELDVCSTDNNEDFSLRSKESGYLHPNNEALNVEDSSASFKPINNTQDDTPDPVQAEFGL